MSRSRFSNQEVFRSEVDRLEKERTRLLRERNQHQFPKGADDDHIRQHPAISQRETQEPDFQQRQYRPDVRRSPRALNPNTITNVNEVKAMLQDVMKNSSRHGIDQKMSVQYLKEIQAKLAKEIQGFNATMRRTAETDKLRDLKVFIDKMLSLYEPTVKASNVGTDRIREAKEGAKPTLEKIPEGAISSNNNQSQQQASSSDSRYQQSSEDKSQESQSNGSSAQENLDGHQTAKKITTAEAAGVLDLLQHRIFHEVSVLRNENNRLRRELEDVRYPHRSHSRGKRKDSIGQNETIINQLQRNDPKQLEAQNYRLKNKIRSLEMELLTCKSLRKIDGPGRDQAESRIHHILDEKDNQIRELRKEVHNLINHLENNKQHVEYLKGEIAQLHSRLSQKTENQQRLTSTLRQMESQIRRLKANSPQFRDHQGKYQQTPYQDRYHRNAQLQHDDTISRKNPDFRKRTIQKEPVYQGQALGRQPTTNQRQDRDNLGQYREILSSLRSIRK